MSHANFDSCPTMTQTSDPSTASDQRHHRFPWWLAFLLTSPLRRLFDDPDDTLGAVVQPGQVVLELGPGNGYFSLPIAKAVGPTGKLVAVDVQPQMLGMLSRRLRRHGLSERVVLRQVRCVEEELHDLRASIDLAVCINVVHELPHPRAAIHAVGATLRPGGRMLIVEPRGHVSQKLFLSELAFAEEAGLELSPEPSRMRHGRFLAMLRKPNDDSTPPAANG
jgi:SAM-dependent methyltransferase